MVVLHFIRVYGRKNLPKKGPFIFASNHVSLGDPPIVGVACNTVPLHFLAKEELFYGKRWGWWFTWTKCIPISRDKNNFKATKEILAKLKEGRAIGLFPEGTRSETGELQEAEIGVGFLAVKSKAPVIPMYIYGSKKALPVGGPYRMGLPIKVYIGKSVDLSEAEKISDRRQKYRFASDKIMQAIASLKRQAE
ncbi:MAG: 1-acyl-sn-glycerol-3-phosphate acyltransferase [Candidatus Omnitrophica bacterium]|nr:1-acyl-sn-glycerol-3-phosphate acyltransferase [Candidatus Omnitrophota bacterium]